MSQKGLEEENKRVSLQVSSLSTQLIDLVGRQSQLEEQLQGSKRENELLKGKLSEHQSLQIRYKDLEETYKKVFSENQSLRKQFPILVKEKEDANEEVSKLQKEVEELTASLFDEANNMVSDANRKADGFSRRNENLIEQLRDKDILLDDLQTQLRELKETIFDRDISPGAGSEIDQIHRTLSASGTAMQETQPILFSPIITAIRYDLKLYAEFRKFIETLNTVDVLKFKDSKFFKKLFTEDIEPSLKLETAPGIGWLQRRPLVSAMIEGRVVIEPVSGINETYRLNFQKNHSNHNSHTNNEEQLVTSNLYAYPSSSPPVAMSSPCALCGESRDDILEHSRLYTMKFHPRDTLSTTLAQNTNMIYPLCSYCLFRVRSSCDIFAFLRSLKTDIWKMSKSSQSEATKDEVMVKKAWVELGRLRARLFWAKVGIWDVENNIITTKITPSLDDPIYNFIKSQSDPASKLGHQYGSTESLVSNACDNAVSVLNSPTIEYKSSPLAQEIKNKGLVEENSQTESINDHKATITTTTSSDEPEIDIVDNYAGSKEQNESTVNHGTINTESITHDILNDQEDENLEFISGNSKPQRTKSQEDLTKEVQFIDVTTTPELSRNNSLERNTIKEENDEFVDA